MELVLKADIGVFALLRTHPLFMGTWRSGPRNAASCGPWYDSKWSSPSTWRVATCRIEAFHAPSDWWLAL